MDTVAASAPADSPRLTRQHTAARLTHMSIETRTDPQAEFDWPETLPENILWMPEKLMTIHGTAAGKTLTAEQVIRLLELHESALARLPTRFSYVPGLLSFREIPAVLAALAQLESRPDLILVDGGHRPPAPLRYRQPSGGAARCTTIGVAKSRLTGEPGRRAPGCRSSTRAS